MRNSYFLCVNVFSVSQHDLQGFEVCKFPCICLETEAEKIFVNCFIVPKKNCFYLDFRKTFFWNSLIFAVDIFFSYLLWCIRTNYYNILYST